jgi:DNA-binding NarL/FixJ family response regulator
VRRANGAPGRIRVGVVEEVEIFRRGLIACLTEDPGITVAGAAADPPLPATADVAVVSVLAGAQHRFACPVVLCCGERDEPRHAASANDVAGVLLRGTMTETQLHATVRAAAAGLRVNAAEYARQPSPDGIEERSVYVLKLLAEGRSTREIAGEMSYSERTIKKLIHELERQLDASSRAQAVAHAIRHGVI